MGILKVFKHSLLFAIKKGKNEKKNAFTFLKTLSNLQRCEINSLAGQMDEDDISVLNNVLIAI